MAAQSLDQQLAPVSLRDEVYALLRQRIISHQYPPDYRFDLSALETQLGISRTPLKEALHRLEAEGLIEIRPRRGTFVTPIDEKRLLESYELRRILERGAAPLIAERVSDATIAEIVALHKKMGALLDQNDYEAIIEEYLDLDRAFHEKLMMAAGNSRLMRMFGRINTFLQVARVSRFFTQQDSQTGTQQEHAPIVAALQARDADRLADAIDQHIARSEARHLSVLKSYG